MPFGTSLAGLRRSNAEVARLSFTMLRRPHIRPNCWLAGGQNPDSHVGAMVPRRMLAVQIPTQAPRSLHFRRRQLPFRCQLPPLILVVAMRKSALIRQLG